MGISFHVHPFPSCGTKCHKDCEGYKGTCTTCIQIKTGKNKGKFGCVHVFRSPTPKGVIKLVHDIFDAHSDSEDQVIEDIQQIKE